MDIQEDFELFEDLALKHAAAFEGSTDYRITNKLNRQVQAVARRLLTKPEGRQLLRGALSDSRAGIRLAAAAYLLGKSPDEALPVLSELAAIPGATGVNAQVIVKAFRKGVFPDFT